MTVCHLRLKKNVNNPVRYTKTQLRCAGVVWQNNTSTSWKHWLLVTYDRQPARPLAPRPSIGSAVVWSLIFIRFLYSCVSREGFFNSQSWTASSPRGCCSRPTCSPRASSTDVVATRCTPRSPTRPSRTWRPGACPMPDCSSGSLFPASTTFTIWWVLTLGALRRRGHRERRRRLVESVDDVYNMFSSALITLRDIQHTILRLLKSR